MFANTYCSQVPLTYFKTSAMATFDFEVIVVGAGIIGSATAYYLSRELGDKVLLLEQYDFLHRRGSSHGDSRITRYTYAKECYTKLMFEAFKLWDEAEKAASMKVYSQTGGLDFGRQDNPSLRDLIDIAKKFKVEHEVFFDAAELSKKFPMIKLPPGYSAVYNPTSGILNATKSVAMFQQLVRSCGGKLLDNSPVKNVTSIKVGNVDGVLVETENGHKFSSRKCILTSGPWTKKLVKQVANLELPLNPIQPTIAYWKVENPEQYSSKTFPVFINYDEPLLYGTPCHEFPNLIKCAAHAGSDADPDNRTFDPGCDDLTHKVSPWLQKFFTGVSPTPQMTESCMYTESPDYDYIIDHLPRFPGDSVLVGCGFSGHGFKMAPVVGKLLSKWAISGEFPYDSELQAIFSLQRFKDGHQTTERKW